MQCRDKTVFPRSGIVYDTYRKHSHVLYGFKTPASLSQLTVFGQMVGVKIHPVYSYVSDKVR